MDNFILCVDLNRYTVFQATHCIFRKIHFLLSSESKYLFSTVKEPNTRIRRYTRNTTTTTIHINNHKTICNEYNMKYILISNEIKRLI